MSGSTTESRCRNEPIMCKIKNRIKQQGYHPVIVEVNPIGEGPLRQMGYRSPHLLATLLHCNTGQRGGCDAVRLSSGSVEVVMRYAYHRAAWRGSQGECKGVQQSQLLVQLLPWMPREKTLPLIGHSIAGISLLPLTSLTTTGFMAGCSSSSWLSRYPALEAILREGSPSLFAMPESSLDSASDFLDRSSNIVCRGGGLITNVGPNGISQSVKP